eukprot:CFRG5499T1
MAFPATPDQGMVIEPGLAPLFKFLSIDYESHMVDPKWKRFGKKNHALLTKGQRKRLDNAIWRAWHLFYVKGIRSRAFDVYGVLDAETPAPSTTSAVKKEDSVLTDGDAYKTPAYYILEGANTESITAAVVLQYKSWRVWMYKRVHDIPYDSLHAPTIKFISDDSSKVNLNNQSTTSVSNNITVPSSLQSDLDDFGDLMDLDLDEILESTTDMMFTQHPGQILARAHLKDIGLGPSRGMIKEPLGMYTHNAIVNSSMMERIFPSFDLTRKSPTVSSGVTMRNEEEEPGGNLRQEERWNKRRQSQVKQKPYFDSVRHAGSVITSNAASGQSPARSQRQSSMNDMKAAAAAFYTSALPSIAANSSHPVQSQQQLGETMSEESSSIQEIVPAQVTTNHGLSQPKAQSSIASTGVQDMVQGPLATSSPFSQSAPAGHHLSNQFSTPNAASLHTAVSTSSTVSTTTNRLSSTLPAGVQFASVPAVFPPHHPLGTMNAMVPMMGTKPPAVNYIPISSMPSASGTRSRSFSENNHSLSGTDVSIDYRDPRVKSRERRENLIAQYQQRQRTMSTTSDDDDQTEDGASLSTGVDSSSRTNAAAAAGGSKRRMSIKNGITALQQVLPDTGDKMSKSITLQKASEHIELLKAKKQNLFVESTRLRGEINALRMSIGQFTHLAPTRTALKDVDDLMEIALHNVWVQQRSRHSLQFAMLCVVLDGKFESFLQGINTSDVNSLTESMAEWTMANCEASKLEGATNHALKATVDRLYPGSSTPSGNLGRK